MIEYTKGELIKRELTNLKYYCTLFCRTTTPSDERRAWRTPPPMTLSEERRTDSWTSPPPIAVDANGGAPAADVASDAIPRRSIPGPLALPSETVLGDMVDVDEDLAGEGGAGAGAGGATAEAEARDDDDTSRQTTTPSALSSRCLRFSRPATSSAYSCVVRSTIRHTDATWRAISLNDAAPCVLVCLRFWTLFLPGSCQFDANSKVVIFRRASSTYHTERC